jgi:hypothetical protein
MLSGVEQLGGMAGWIRHHHERWDGTGYPDRLVGQAIPLASRVIALAAGYNDALARDGGSAATWRWKQGIAGEFDPELVSLLEDEINNRPSGTAAAEAAAKIPNLTLPSVPRVGAGGEKEGLIAEPDVAKGIGKEAWIDDPKRKRASNPLEEMVPVRRLRPGMVLGQSITMASGGAILLKHSETLTKRQIDHLLTLVASGKVSGEAVTVFTRLPSNDEVV